jgi:hypothetical protein
MATELPPLCCKKAVAHTLVLPHVMRGQPSCPGLFIMLLKVATSTGFTLYKPLPDQQLSASANRHTDQVNSSIGSLTQSTDRNYGTGAESLQHGLQTRR